LEEWPQAVASTTTGSALRIEENLKVCMLGLRATDEPVSVIHISRFCEPALKTLNATCEAAERLISHGAAFAFPVRRGHLRPR
jgi:hypothetical protein